MYRGWQDNSVFSGPFSERDAWVWLIEHAAFKPARVKVKGDFIDLDRGQLCFAQRFMAEKWSWSKSRVDRFLKRLASEGMISICSKIGATAGQGSGQGQSIITICNYDKYQITPDTARGNDEIETGQQRGNSGAKNNEGNELRAARAHVHEGNSNLADLTSRVAKQAGVPIPDFGKASEYHLLVQGWLTAGASEVLILETVATRTAAARKPPRTLRWFDAAVLEAIAGKAAETATNGSTSMSLAAKIVAEMGPVSRSDSLPTERIEA
jgi:hypothetical protein